MSEALHRHVTCLKKVLTSNKLGSCPNKDDRNEYSSGESQSHSTIVRVGNDSEIEFSQEKMFELESLCETKANNKENSSHLIGYFETFFNIGYFLFIIPFRLARESHGGSEKCGSYVVQSNPCQKVLCSLVHMLIAYEYLSSVRLIRHNYEETPVEYLSMATVIASFLYVVFFIYVFWFKEDCFREMILDLQNLEFAITEKKTTARNIRVLAMSFCLFAIFVALTDPMIHDGLFLREKNRNVLKKYACKARSYYLFKPCPDHLPVDQLPPNETILDHFVLGVHLIILIPNLILVHVVDVAVVLTVICLWQVLKKFMEFSKKPTTSAEQALAQYEVLKKLVLNTNSAVGLLTFSSVAVSLPFYASWGAIVLNDKSIDWLYLVHIMTYFINFILILTLAADLNFRVGEFYRRVSAPDISEGLASHRLISLLMDQHSNQISMRGCGFFVMTYRFLGTILSIIVTYTMIILQFQFTRRNNLTLSSINGCNCSELVSNASSLLANFVKDSIKSHQARWP